MDCCHHAREVNVTIEHCLRLEMVTMMMTMLLLMLMLILMLMMMMMMLMTICPASTVKLFMVPAILGPPVHLFPKSDCN